MSNLQAFVNTIELSEYAKYSFYENVIHHLVQPGEILTIMHIVTGTLDRTKDEHRHDTMVKYSVQQNI